MTRTLVCILPDAQDIVGWDLSGFDCLDAITVQMTMPLHEDPFAHFINVPQSVVTLDLTGMYQAGPMQMKAVAKPLQKRSQLSGR
ncbi:hypothetical protein NEOLEDRAFT_1132861 [Neolentinus lepideus HHB14362 ss-1]|uniref:Uncharacterized protein n=1 Tax=Neolentinus lepideus HHB14362 ss-1 TaxID=1314782 RepID=A0A165SYM8_9AGAM|nr:hypothetical protein NEOLEDRAFT_1132861 [Neolentinus lepideus HHB14362 ss-1]